MRRTLLISNDFPPKPGGIESYVYELASRLPAERLVAYVPNAPGADEVDVRLGFPVIRHPGSLALPTPTVAARAARLAREHRCGGVWFGAAAPLGILEAPLRRAGIEQVVASTHGHETGWAMLPGARRVLRRIGRGSDVVTAVSGYTRRALAGAVDPGAGLRLLPPGVDTEVFRPDPAARAEIRDRYRLGRAPVVVCVARLVPRKGQDALIRALAQVRSRVPDTVLLLVGDGRYRAALRRTAARCRIEHAVVWARSVPTERVPAHLAAADVFAMPCRTRAGGLDVEGLGIAALEAAAAGLPVIAGDSGGAPETVREGVTGHVVDGRDVAGLAWRLSWLLADADARARMGAAGREWMRTEWSWDQRAEQLRRWL